MTETDAIKAAELLRDWCGKHKTKKPAPCKYPFFYAIDMKKGEVECLLSNNYPNWWGRWRA